MRVFLKFIIKIFISKREKLIDIESPLVERVA